MENVQQEHQLSFLQTKSRIEKNLFLQYEFVSFLLIIQGLSEKQQDWVCCVTYWWKRNKQNALSYMISSEYITVILTFYNHGHFFGGFFHTLLWRQIMVASSWQCTCSQCPEHLAVLGQEKRCPGKIFLFTWSCSMWLFLLPQAQGDHERNTSWRHEGHQEGRNNGT